MLPIIRPPFADLIRNYRSHPAIIATPSSLFYNDTLEPTAPHTESLLPWSGFEGRPMPVLFADNRTADEIERDGGGWYNLGEVDVAINFAVSFLRENLVRQEEICIMSPFSAQVRALRLRARRPDLRLSNINIGPLEAFQGLESRLVILCTTRTRDRFIDQDLAKGLGVIHEPRRFIVALTRAKEGLIVIGHPGILSQDENWASFMAFCRRNGAWFGTGPDDWHTPHSRKIKMSRLEKQIQFRSRVEEDIVNGDQGLSKRMRRLGLMRSEEDEQWEAGVDAEEAVAVDEGIVAEDANGEPIPANENNTTEGEVLASPKSGEDA
jgi:helicase MOV-10